MGLLTAIRFLTAIPVPLAQQMNSQQVGRCMVYFPVVGALLGLLLLGLDRILALVLPASIVNAILVLALVLATGALHLDGLIDTCDGLGGPGTPERRWELMRDSRIGSFGAIAAFALLLLKYVSLGGLPELSRGATLLLTPTLGRWAVVWAILLFPYARPDGLGRTFRDQVTWPRAAQATAFTLAITLLVLRLKGLAVMLGVWVATLALATFLRRKFAGLTGDTYGAIIETGELTALLLAVAIPSWSW